MSNAPMLVRRQWLSECKVPLLGILPDSAAMAVKIGSVAPSENLSVLLVP